MSRKILPKIGLFIVIAGLLFLGVRRLVTYDIWTAVRENNIYYVNAYLNKGGNSNLTKTILGKSAIDNYTLLMQAARYGRSQIVDLLINHGANVNAYTTLYDTPLIYAMRAGNLEVIKSLVKNNADINWDINNAGGGVSSSASTPIASAIFYGHIDVVRFLLNHGARITDQCIRLAVHKNRPDIIHLLIENGAGVTQNDINLAEFWNKKAMADLLRKYL